MAAPRFIGSVRVIAALTLVSRVLGLLRDTVFTAVFGTSASVTAFNVAFRIPNLFRRLFGEGALSASFIPIFSRRYYNEGPESAQAVARQVIGLQVAVLAGLTILGEFAVLGLLLAGPSGTDEISYRNRLTLILTAIMLPHVLSICTTALLGGMLNILKNFWLPTFAPIILNIFEVAGVAVAWGLHRGHPDPRSVPRLWPVVIGVMAAGIVQVIIPWYALKRRGISIIPKVAWSDPAVITILKLMGPTALGLAAVQINTLMDSLIAMLCIREHIGAPYVLDLAQRLYQLPLGVIGISVATAIFEQMSAEAAHNKIADLRNTALEGLKLMLFVGLPISVGMCLLTWPLTSLLFQRSRFTPADTDMVAYTSLFFTLGIWSYMSQHVYARGFYVLQKPQIPARISMYVVGLNLTLNLTLVWFMKEAGLALSTAISAYVQLVLLSKAWRDLTGSFAIKGLLVLAGQDGGGVGGDGWRDPGDTLDDQPRVVRGRGRLACAGGAADAHHHLGNAVHLMASVVAGGVVFWTIAHVLGCPETRTLLEGLGRRRAREQAVSRAAPTSESVEPVVARSE